MSDSRMDLLRNNKNFDLNKFRHRDYFMVGERVRFLFMSELSQANE